MWFGVIGHDAACLSDPTYQIGKLVALHKSLTGQTSANPLCEGFDPDN